MTLLSDGEPIAEPGVPLLLLRLPPRLVVAAHVDARAADVGVASGLVEDRAGGRLLAGILLVLTGEMGASAASRADVAHRGSLLRPVRARGNRAPCP